MTKYIFTLIVFFGGALPMTAHGQDTQPETGVLPENVTPTDATTQDAAVVETEDSAPPVVQENTVSQCSDKIDNDNDGHVDCEDQDCRIFAVCVDSAAQPAPPAAAASAQSDTPSAQSDAPSKASPSEELISRPVSIGFVPGLSTDSAAEGEVLNHFSLNFIGWQDHLSGAELSLIGAIRKGNVTGFQGSNLFNVVAGDMRGLQSSGLVNVTAGQTSGLQAAGLVNSSGESVHGLQLSGLVNGAGGSVTGLQGAGLVNFAGESVHGLQLSGLVNVAGGSMAGFQGAGLVSFAGESVQGLQLSGLVNVAGESMAGFQGAGLVNVSGAGSRGLQMSGLANVVTGDFTGLQLSLVNFGTNVSGAQVGLVNIASKSMKGAQVGLVNYAGDGIFAPTVWMSPASMINLGLKMGARNVYGIFGGGVHPIGDDRRTSVAFGLGAHGNLSERWWLEFDLMHNRLYDQKSAFDEYDVDFIEQARLNLGFRFARDFSLYVGPTLDVLVSEVRDDFGFATFYTHTDKSSDTTVAISMGFTAGIQWEPKIGRLNTRD